MFATVLVLLAGVSLLEATERASPRAGRRGVRVRRARALGVDPPRTAARRAAGMDDPRSRPAPEAAMAGLVRAGRGRRARAVDDLQLDPVRASRVVERAVRRRCSRRRTATRSTTASSRATSTSTARQAISDKAGLTLKDDESQEDVVYQRAAIDYIKGHVSRSAARRGGAPAAHRRSVQDLAVRARRLVRRGPQPVLDLAGRACTASGLLALLSIAGAVILRRRANAPPLYPLLAPIVVVIADRADHLREHALSHDRRTVVRRAGRDRDRRRCCARRAARGYASARN